MQDIIDLATSKGAVAEELARTAYKDFPAVLMIKGETYALIAHNDLGRIRQAARMQADRIAGLVKALAINAGQ